MEPVDLNISQNNSGVNKTAPLSVTRLNLTQYSTRPMVWQQQDFGVVMGFRAISEMHRMAGEAWKALPAPVCGVGGCRRGERGGGVERRKTMITSRQNPVVQEIRTIVRKREVGRFVLEGPILLEEALRAEIVLDLLVVAEHAQIGTELLVRAVENGARRLDVTDQILEYLSDSQHPQGVIAVARVPEWSWPGSERTGGPVVMLDEVRDPGNLGTILRTALAAGAEGIILAGRCVDPWSPKVVRASAGAVFRIPTVQWPRAEAVRWVATQRGIAVHARGTRDLFEVDLVPPVVLVLGSESHGVGEDLLAACPEGLRIPMAAHCESLNVAVATAVTLYQSMAQVRAVQEAG